MCDLFYYTSLGTKHFASSVDNLQVYKKAGFICKSITKHVEGYDVNVSDAVLFGTTIPKILRYLVPASSGVGFETV